MTAGPTPTPDPIERAGPEGRAPYYQDGTVTLWHGDCVDIMRGMDDNSIHAIVTDLAAGTAAEHLVCADLLLNGWRAFLTDQNCPYDVAVEVTRRLVRIQVKATRKPRAVPQRIGHQPGYLFNVRRAGKGGHRRYGQEDFDLLALVALDSRQIAYLPITDVPTTVIFRPHDDAGPIGPNGGGKTGRVFSAYPFARALKEIT